MSSGLRVFAGTMIHLNSSRLARGLAKGHFGFQRQSSRRRFLQTRIRTTQKSSISEPNNLCVLCASVVQFQLQNFGLTAGSGAVETVVDGVGEAAAGSAFQMNAAEAAGVHFAQYTEQVPRRAFEAAALI